ncbi:MAG: hypothetical protein A2X94_15920 [Bdellovibrionales bacterium GWB1_55_8]|nr:MAG: hypothetical protein A2X94_15920 [Bdellovibrionales bacterium GWB1_55_8]
MLITQLLSQIAVKNPTRPAYRYLGKETSFSELKIRVARLSYLFQNEIGHHPGGVRVAFLARNSPALIQTFFALTNIRATSIPIDPDRPRDEIENWLKESGATHLAVTSDLIAPAREILSSARLSLPIIEIEKKQGGEYDSSFTAQTDNQPAENDIILILRTAGTTGHPKLVTFTHKQLRFGASSIRGTYHINLSDRFLTKISWAHPFAFLHALLFPILSGATVVIDHGLEGAEFLDFLIESRTNRVLGAPLFFWKLLMTCRSEKRTLPGIKSITVAGGPLSSDVARVFGLMKISVGHCYGQTENLWTISMQDTALSEGSSSAEKGLPGFKYKVVDDNGDEIPGPKPRTGRLAVTTPTAMSGYYRHGAEKKDLAQETKNALRGTWLYTGDVARLDGDGDTLSIQLLGRQSDLLHIDEEYESLNEVNQVLKEIQGVDDGAAFIVPRATGKPIVLCAIVRGAGSISDKQILDYCVGKLPANLAPKAVAFTDFIPKDFGNQPNYTKLRHQFSGITS